MAEGGSRAYCSIDTLSQFFTRTSEGRPDDGGDPQVPSQYPSMPPCTLNVGISNEDHIKEHQNEQRLENLTGPIRVILECEGVP